MRVLVCGDRNWDRPWVIESELRALMKHYTDIVIYQGGARGADLLARDIAVKLGLPVYQMNAHWAHTRQRSDDPSDALCPPDCKQVTGRGAGPIRNRKMMDRFQPELVLAFHDDLAHSKGTADMVNVATRAGVRVRVVQG